MEDYKEKYEIALKTVQEILDSGADSIKMSRLKLRLQSVFSELKESDEKIKEALIALVKCNERCGYSLLNNVSTSSMIAWIEKQGETTIWDKKDEQILNAAILHIKNKTYNYCGGYTSEYVIQWLESLKNRYIWTPIEKQGEQIDIANKEYWRGYREGKKEILDKYAELEKQGKETISQSYLAPKSASQAIKEIITDNANKIEPKFHEGDWIILTAGELSVTLQIINVDINRERYWFNDGSYLPFADEECMHLWTIQDAKDGDILWHSDSASNGIFIFKKIRNDGKVLCYCDYDSEDHFCLGEYHTCCWTSSKYVKPATKEQCDLLFAKIHEAGYEWNFDKKELIKL